MEKSKKIWLSAKHHKTLKREIVATSMFHITTLNQRKSAGSAGNATHSPIFNSTEYRGLFTSMTRNG